MPYEIEYDYDYNNIDTEAETFEDLPEEVQNDLSEWFNVKELDEKDKQLLLELYKEGQFYAWDCPKCNARVFEGNPDDWDNFQGALNQDFCYFGDEDIYQPDYLRALCDNCRCHAH